MVHRGRQFAGAEPVGEGSLDHASANTDPARDGTRLRAGQAFGYRCISLGPGAEPAKGAEARGLLGQGHGILKVAKKVGLGMGTVQRLKRHVRAVVD
jgi:hypothetical protein